MAIASNSDVANYYDKFWTVDKREKINSRHRLILKALKKQGMKGSSTVLEIGCGNGLLSVYLAKSLSSGKFTGVDISPETIKRVSEQYKHVKNVEFKVSDMSDYRDGRTYDFIIFPDVLEHIPIENHKDLFKTIQPLMHDKTVVFINVPHPRGIEWFQKHRPDLMQIIDQSVETDKLLEAAYAAGLYLESLESYSIVYDQPEYQRIVLKRMLPRDTMEMKPKLVRLFSSIKWRLQLAF